MRRDERRTDPGGTPPLGAAYDGAGTTFAVWASRATRVEVCLFGADGREERIPLEAPTNGVWHTYLPGVEPAQLYGYRADGPWDPATGHRFNAAKLLTDPYARAITGTTRAHWSAYGHLVTDQHHRDERDSAPYVPRSVVVDPAFDWGDDQPPNIPWTDTVLYETHVRGLTMRHPKVPERLRGTYAGLAHPAVLDELATLGVTAVELLPVHQFASEHRLHELGLSNYWGYNSLGFFAPHGAYSSSGTRGEQVCEFKQMVSALHQAGLEVILDVVYNHTCEQGDGGPTLSFRGLHNAAYYRLRDAGRHYVDFTGTGNTLNVRHPRVVQLIADSLRYWVEEMHVDGFRFDLAPALARGEVDVDMRGSFITVLGQDPVLSRVKLIAEPWDVGPGGYQVGAFPPPWSEWNDRFRDSVRDFWRGHSGGVWDLASRLSGSSDLYRHNGRGPFASINLITSHDGFTMRDLVTYEKKHNQANGEDNQDGHSDNRSHNYGVEGETDDEQLNALRRRQIRNMMATLILSAGVPMLTAGDERGRTQLGNNNAYCQDNEVSWLDWHEADDWGELTQFVRTLLRIRSEHEVFRRHRFFSGKTLGDSELTDVGWFASTGQLMTSDDWHNGALQTLGMFVTGADPDQPASGDTTPASFLIWLHAGAEPTDVTLPPASWAPAYEILADTAQPAATEHATPEAGDRLRLTERSLLLLKAS